MKYYLAPLEGITNIYYRNTFTKYFRGIDKIYIPFINPSSFTITNKEKREIDPSLNDTHNVKLIPQIISKSAKDTIWLINQLNELGYDEINLNFGCPSGTVVAKGRGAGILKDLDFLDSYLKEVFENTSSKISIKLRLGLNDVNEFENIIKILNKYDICELIIHPRTGKEKYVGPIHLDYFSKIKDMTSLDIIYNGEIKSKKDIEYIINSFPFIKGIMLGRGLIACPYLLDNEINASEKLNAIKSFYNEISSQYLEKFGWNNTKFFLKEIWVLLINSFEVTKDQKKKLFKSERQEEFINQTNEIFSSCPLKDEIESGLEPYI